MRGMMRLCAALLLLGVMAYAQAEPFRLAPFAAHYSVKLDGLKVGELEQSVSARNDGSWMFETVMYTTGVVSWFKSDRVVEQSLLRPLNDTLQPISYSYRYTGRNKDVMERVDFDWKKGEARSLRDGKITVLPAAAGLLDKQSYQLLVRRDLQRGLKKMSYPIAERSRLTSFDLEVVGEELITTPFGKYRTLKITRGASTLWCAPELGYALVKLVREEDGHTFTSYITSLTH